MGGMFASLVAGSPALGVAATITVQVKDGASSACPPLNPNSLAGNCGKLKIENSPAGGTAKAEVLSDNTVDRLRLSKVKFTTQPGQNITNYTIEIEATGLQGPPDGAQVAYRTSASGTMSTSSPILIVSSWVKASDGTSYTSHMSPYLNNTFFTWTKKDTVSSPVSGARSIKLVLTLPSMQAGQWIDLGSQLIQVRNEAPGDDPPDEARPAFDLRDIIQNSSREACFGIYTIDSACYGVHIK